MAKRKAKNAEDSDNRTLCGVIMPIRAQEPYRKEHWADVLGVITESVEWAGFSCRMVSQAPDTRFIHDTIVNSLFDSDIIVADVSSKNPNVLFEVGIRLTFDKPIVLIIDDKTEYLFDVGGIEHLKYPSDLRYQDIQEFKINLGKKVKATYEASKQAGYKSFLKHFQILRAPTIESKDGTKEDVILQQLAILKMKVDAMRTPASVEQWWQGSFSASTPIKFVDFGNESDKRRWKVSVQILKSAFEVTEEHAQEMLTKLFKSTPNTVSQVVATIIDVTLGKDDPAAIRNALITAFPHFEFLFE